MNEIDSTYFLFGGSFFTKLYPILQEQGKVVGQWRGVSPMSAISLSTQEDKRELSYWLPELDTSLATCQAKYFVLDLQLALTHLLASDAGFISASAENMEMINRNEIPLVDPILLPDEEVEVALNRFTTVITKHFTANHIILIHTNNSPYWLVGNNLRAEGSKAADARHAAWLKELEQQFCKKTGCYFVDVTRFYFYQKEKGKPLTNVVWEKECYQDVAKRIFDIAAGGDGKAERPDFALSIDRYVAYYFTIQKKPQRIFLDENYFLDHLILSASGDFVKQYREELIDLDVLDWHDSGRALCVLNKMKPDSVVTKICTAFHFVCNGNYYDTKVDYAQMFRCEVVPEELLSYLKKEYASKENLLPTQINRYNAGYHFACMLGKNPTSFSTKKTVEKPVIVDVFGSCIGRTLFNVQDYDFAVNNYWFHVPPFEFRNKPVDFQDFLFSGKLNWKDRLVKQQFECTVYQQIEESAGEWLVIDLYSLISPNNFYYQDCLYGDFDHRISTELKAKSVSLMKKTNPIGSQDDVIAALDPWLEVIKKKYDQKIILVDGQRLQHWIGDDDRIYMLPKGYTCNEYMARAAEYVREKIDCYQIKIGKYFLPDDLGYMRNTPVHKEDACYFAAHDITRYIVDNLPEQKIFTQYSGRIHMAHLERLAKDNSATVLNQALPLNELDKVVVQLGYEQMRYWHDALVEIYEKSDWSTTLEEVLSAYVSSDALADVLQKAATLTGNDDVTIRYGYDDYPDDGQIVSGFFGNCDLSVMPNIKLKKVVNDKGTVVVSWAAPVETAVRIYRKAKNMPWVLIGKSTAGVFYDETTEPLTDYRYCICAEVNQGSRCYLANFTNSVVIRSAPATPILVSAVHFAGVNTLRWAAVPGAESYRIYHKDSLAHKWEVCATVGASNNTCYEERSKFPTGGEWYTVRALCTIDGAAVAGGFQSGLCALPL